MSVGVGIDEFAVLNDGDGGGGNAGLLQNLLGDAIDAGFEVGRDGVDGLRLRADHERNKQRSKTSKKGSKRFHSLPSLSSCHGLQNGLGLRYQPRPLCGRLRASPYE